MRLLKLHPRPLQQYHARAIVSGLIHDPFVAGNLLESLLRTDRTALGLASARALFDSARERSTFMWNTLISAHVSADLPSPAAALFNQMLQQATRPNHHTFPPVLKALSQLRCLRTGESLQAMIFKHGLGSDDFVCATLVHFYGALGRVSTSQRVFDGTQKPNVSAWTALLSGYTKSGDLVTARELFDKMPERNPVSWSAMISGYVQCGRPMEALALFREMLVRKLRPSSSVLVGVLVAVAELGALEEGKWVHIYLERSGLDWSPNLRTSLVHMYARCGDIVGAWQVFDKMRDHVVDVWNAMITGLGLHGKGKEALQLFDNMVSEGLRPDDMTFVGVLCACSHAGLVSEGLAFFYCMSQVHGVPPKTEHYSCVVDILGRAGLLAEALELINSMPMMPNRRVWGSLFGACRIFWNVELGEIIGKHMIELEPHRARHYVLLANFYVSIERRKDAVNVRETMKQRGVHLEPGCSLIEVDGVVHEFLVGDRAHPSTGYIYEILGSITKLISSRGYVPSMKH